MVLPIGRLIHRVSVQSPTYTTDERGASVLSWATDHSRWALVEEQGGTESLDERGVGGSLSIKVTMRYYSGLTEKQRLIFENRVLEIRIITNPDGQKIETVCECEEAI